MFQDVRLSLRRCRGLCLHVDYLPYTTLLEQGKESLYDVVDACYIDVKDLVEIGPRDSVRIKQSAAEPVNTNMFLMPPEV